jgi:hypothetical protein
LQRISMTLFSVIAMLSIMGCAFSRNNDRFGTGYGHKGMTADTVEVGLPFLPNIGCKIAPPPGEVIKGAHCGGDSIDFSLPGKKATIAIDDLDFQFHLGVKGKPQLNIEKTLFGTQYTVYCQNWEQKMQFFPCLAY